MATVYLALGSNIGNRAENLRKATALLGESGVSIQKMSSIYETEPLDYLDQDWFLNAALEAETDLEPHALLKVMRGIEAAMGSRKAFSKGPRLIDLDVLLYGNECIATPELQIPHPRMLSRRFVLVPLAEIAPNLRHPSWPASAKQMLERCSDASEIREFR